MISQEAYKLKIEAKMEPIIAKIAELKTLATKYIADATVKYSQPLAELDEMHHATMLKLTELGNVSQESWEGLEAGVESTLDALVIAIKETTAKFKAESSSTQTATKK